MKPSYEELEARCAALAAENAGLKKSEPAPFSKLMMEALDIYQAGAEDVPELAMLSAYKKLRDGLKTPATDAFLAEVRAHAVEMFSGDEKKLSESHMQDGNLDTAIQIASSSRRASDFASQLRKGAQS